MGEAAVKKPGGLAGITAGETAIATVGKEGAGLTYRGYDIYDLAEHAQFEEVAYLLHYGKLPNAKELKQYRKRLAKLREVPKALRKVLEGIPKKAHPMDVLRTGVSFLGNLEPEGGGLLVYPHKAPADWEFERFNRDPAAIMKFLDAKGSAPIRVPHRANRAVIFDSDLFHATDALRFREGYLSRRINITMLYGQRGERA